jgi:TonB family protein
VSDTISRLLAERERLDQGLPTTLLLSLAGHVALAGAALLVPLLLPREPAIRLNDDVFTVVLPRGGAGTPQAPAPPPPEPVAKPKPVESAAPAPPPAPVVLKPPPKAQPRPNALPLPDAKAVKHPPTPPPVRTIAKPSPGGATGTAAVLPAAKSTASATPGLEIGTPGVGSPTGSDTGGDWYLASVQQKIWMIWNQQIKTGYTQSVGVTFTIQPDGSVTDIKATEPSGVPLLDLAAQRAVFNAQPFGPLPREYGQKPRTIRALFKPTY